VLLGQDIAEYGGAFKVTAGFVPRFGRERVRNTLTTQREVAVCEGKPVSPSSSCSS